MTVLADVIRSMSGRYSVGTLTLHNCAEKVHGKFTAFSVVTYQDLIMGLLFIHIERLPWFAFKNVLQC